MQSNSLPTEAFPIQRLCLAVLENMKSHYGKGIQTRAVKVDRNGDVASFYLAPHGAKDPIGRLLTQIEIEIILAWLQDPTNIATCISGFYLADRDRFPSLNKFPDRFLVDIQKWHDTDENWDKKGVSDKGWENLNLIKQKILKMQR